MILENFLQLVVIETLAASKLPVANLRHGPYGIERVWHDLPSLFASLKTVWRKVVPPVFGMCKMSRWLDAPGHTRDELELAPKTKE